jgi:hypothetical protein
VLSERAGFFEDPDLYVTQSSTGLAIRFYETSELDRAGKSCRSASNEQHIHRDRFRIGSISEYEAVKWQWRLVAGRLN